MSAVLRNCWVEVRMLWDKFFFFFNFLILINKYLL